MLHARFDLPGQDIDLCDPVDLVAEKLNTDRIIIRHYRNDLDHISAHPEGTALEIHVVTVVLDADQLFDDLVAFFLHARAE